MSKAVFILCLFAYSLLAAHSESIPCPEIKTISDFKPQQYIGKWYEIQKYPQIFELNEKCVTATYSLNPNGTVHVLNQAIIPPNTPAKIEGTATPNPTNSANLTVEFPGIPTKGKYWVIDTDYTSYSLVYSCTFFDNVRIESAWILSRNRTLEPEKVSKLKEELTKVKSSTNLFKTTNQKDCTN